MKKLLLITTISLLSISSIAQEAKYWVCFTNDNNENLQLSVCFAGSHAVSVKYKGQTETIPLEFIKEEMPKGGSCQNVITTYKEVYQGKVSGTYVYTHCGNWDYIKYIRAKDKKVFNFTINHELTGKASESSTPCF